MDANEEGEEGRWLCASCGTRHDTNDKPCRNCASEQFAKLEKPDTYQINEIQSVTWVCDNCGKESPRNNSQCRDCGSFSYSKKTKAPDSDDTAERSSSDTGLKISARTLVAAGGGLFAALQVLGALLRSHASLVLYVGALMVALPSTRSRVENIAGFRLSTGATVILYFALIILGNLWIYGTL